MKSKRGQSLPMNTIVIAAIVLIVLVVIVMIFTGSMGSFVKGLKKDCKMDLGGVCGNFRCDSSLAPENSVPITGTSCEILNKDKDGNNLLQDGQVLEAGKNINKYCCIVQE